MYHMTFSLRFCTYFFILHHTAVTFQSAMLSLFNRPLSTAGTAGTAGTAACTAGRAHHVHIMADLRRPERRRTAGALLSYVICAYPA